MTEELVEIYEFFRNGEEKPYLAVDHEGVEHHYPYQGKALVLYYGPESPRFWSGDWVAFWEPDELPPWLKKKSVALVKDSETPQAWHRHFTYNFFRGFFRANFQAEMYMMNRRP